MDFINSVFPGRITACFLATIQLQFIYIDHCQVRQKDALKQLCEQLKWVFRRKRRAVVGSTDPYRNVVPFGDVAQSHTYGFHSFQLKLMLVPAAGIRRPRRKS